MVGMVYPDTMAFRPYHRKSPSPSMTSTQMSELPPPNAQRCPMPMLHRPLPFVLVSTLLLLLDVALGGSVGGVVQLPAGSPTSVSVWLRSPQQQQVVPTNAQGRFNFDAVSPGHYLLEVHHRDFSFDSYRVEVTQDATVISKLLVRERLAHPLVVLPVGSAIYYEQPPSYNPLGMFKNPMVLILGVGALLMFAMPKMMANIDPEAMQQMQARPQGRVQRRAN